MEHIESWGRYPRTNQTETPLFWQPGPLPASGEKSLLAHGLGRSYGDVCLNHGGHLMLTRYLDRMIAFDAEQGILTCEAGLSFAAILDLFLPRGWFPPVTPGTKHVTVGGAIANDIHGKNHHGAGTFGNHVLSLDLLRSDGNRLTCSPQTNRELFTATVGGMGLTGLILTATLQLKRIRTAWIDNESIKFSGLDDFETLSDRSDKDHEHTVAWLDCLARGRHFGRGIFFRGNHAGPEIGSPRPPRQRSLTVPFEAPSFLVNRFSISLFNKLYFHKQVRKRLAKTVFYDPFFYPLDSINRWNLLHGKRGFLQYQCVVPDLASVADLLEGMQKAKIPSFLCVLKKFGGIASPGLMSFPKKGYTLAMDIPVSDKAFSFLETADEAVAAKKGAVYPAKDARMSPRHFQMFFPQWKQFKKHIDPAFSSSFWRRVSTETESKL